MLPFARHNWDASTPGSLLALGSSNQLHFDGGDFDLLVQMQSDEEYKLKSLRWEYLPGNPLDYDIECAKDIVSFADALGQSNGIMDRISLIHDLSDVDWPSYRAVQQLRDALLLQWGGHGGLWRAGRQPGSN